jgi:hypothetical protein
MRQRVVIAGVLFVASAGVFLGGDRPAAEPTPAGTTRPAPERKAVGGTARTPGPGGKVERNEDGRKVKVGGKATDR